MKKISKKLNYALYMLGILSVIGGFFVFSGDTSFYSTSVVSLPEHKSFDGTVYPVSVIPNYVKLKADRYKLPFESYDKSELISIPKYNADDLKKSYNDLVWGNSADDAIRNAKLTYSTPYMGNYKLDGVENAGSHLAVDIVIPTGTPVYSIANGVVVKVSQLDSGFGKHIVVQHNNVPSLNDPAKKVTLFSSYSHLSQTNVSVNDVVVKGQMIAKSGSTGTVTTPHLHFQIDNTNAPWHPYWPFTWKEASDVGLDFFSAINAGLGKDKALSTTVNPVVYVQKYLNYSNSSNSNDSVFNTSTNTPVETVKPVVATPSVVVEETPAQSYIPESSNNVVVPQVTNTPVVEEVVVETPIVETPVVETPVVETPVVEEVVVEPPVLTFNFEVSPIYYYENTDLSFTVSLTDKFGKQFSNGFSGDILISPVNENIRVSSPLVNFLTFSKNASTVKKFVVRNSGKERLKIEYDGNTFYSDWFEVVKVEKDSIFKDVSAKSKYHDALEYLNLKGVVNGYSDGTFKPNNSVSRVEALKLVLKSTDEKLETGKVSFKDTDSNQWYGEYLYTAVQKGIVNGYADGTFKPSNSVTKAEFYKMLLNTAGIKVSASVESSTFVDVKVDDWFAPYFNKAYELGIIDSDVKYVSPSTSISRGESAYAIFKVLTSI